MYNHLESIAYLYGDSAYIQMPNDIFKVLSKNTKSFQQSCFTYSYLVLCAFLYKYASYIDFNNKTYIQNNDIKQILGYSKFTKSIDYIIKKDGMLDSIGLTESTRDYPVLTYLSDEKINGINMIEFKTINDIKNTDSDLIDDFRAIVKNRNYEIKIPLFLFEYKEDIGTLYNYSNTHKIKLKEFMEIIYNKDLLNIGFSLYSYLKSKCYGYEKREIRIMKIIDDIGVCRYVLDTYLNKLKKHKYIEVRHAGWVDGELNANEYIFKGV